MSSQDNGSGHHDDQKRGWFAMIPESLICGRIEGLSTAGHAAALHLYCYLDLKSNNSTWPVKGFRNASRDLGWQPKTVKKYATILADAGLIDVQQNGKHKAEMRVVHNPARRRWNPGVHIGPSPMRHGHSRREYAGSPSSRRDVPSNAQEAPVTVQDPGARDAQGPISPMCEHLSPDTLNELTEMLEQADRCPCGLYLRMPEGGDANPNEFCVGPFA